MMQHRYRNIIIPVLCLIAILCTIPANAQARYFTIDKFHSDIAINRDGSIMVEETITVEFHHARHGIFREIPYKYRNALGETETTPIEVLTVVDGKNSPRPYRARRKGNVVNIRIGHPDRYVDGMQVYKIRYRVEHVLLYMETHDELYWNVTGTYWDVPIREASCRIIFNAEQDISEPRTGCYTGRHGSRESACTVTGLPRGAEFICTRELEAGEGLTVAYGWEKGLIEYPSEWELFLRKYNLRENWVFAFPFISLIVMTLLYFKRGRDPKVRVATVVLYEPPEVNGEPLNAAEVGAIVDESMDPRDLSGTLIGLAEKGYLKISEQKKEGLIDLLDTVDYQLIKVKEADSDLSDFERDFLNDIFGGKETVMVSEMKKEFYKHLEPLRKKLMSGLSAKGFFAVRPGVTVRRYVGYAFIIMISGGLISALFLGEYILKAILATFLTGIWPAIFAGAMPVKTRAGARAKIDSMGFREFMMRADKDRLERLGKDVFYKYMPYAIALDVVDHWAEAFEGITSDPPRWYVSTMGLHAFRPVAFSKTINTATSTIASNMFSAPRGSGSSSGFGGGGGGFSGGGGGGGGGGSW